MELKKTLDLDPLISEIRIVHLKGSANIDSRFADVKCADSLIYLHDNKNYQLYAYTLDGRLKYRINHVSFFDIFQHKVFAYDQHNGKMNIYNNGQLDDVINIGYRGMEFITLSDSLFAFHTGGLPTQDSAGDKYEIAIVDYGGKLKKTYIPVNRSKSGIRFAQDRRFTRNGSVIYFLPSLSSTLYNITVDSVKAETTFDFGKYQLTDSIFLKIKDLEDYNFFPYLQNLRLITADAEMLQFSYLMQGTEGTLFINRLNNKVVRQGLGNRAGLASGFIHTTPDGKLGDEFFALVNKREVEKTQQLRDSFTRGRNSIFIEKSHDIGLSMLFYQIHLLSEK